MRLNSDKTYSSAYRFTVVFSVVAALILPAGYFIISYEYLKGVMETAAEINSQNVSTLISRNPELWQYETVRIEELLARRPRSGVAETRRIFDTKNTLIAESVNTLQHPLITASHDIKDSGEPVGRIEISRSLMPILLNTGILAIFGLGFGLLLYHWLPFSAVIKTGEKLRDANDFLKKVMEGSTNSLVVLDLADNIQMFNRRFEALTGRQSEELLGHSFIRQFTGDACTKIDKELHKVSTGMVGNITFETQFRRHDDLTLSLFCGAVPLLSNGIISGIVISLDDITDRINAEEERIELERQFQQTQKLESLGVLAGGIAHDFNNILTIILGYCNVIKEDSDSVSVNTDYVQKVEDAANRAADLCRQMLTYAGKNELQHVPVNLNSLVNELVKMLHSGIKKNVSIELDLQGLQVIMADSSQIQQVIMNLIINASEAIGENSGAVIISLKKKEVMAESSESDFFGRRIPSGLYACLEVSDNGCGMDTKTQNRIFEPFYTTKFTGRGLGMSATLGIIKAHNGALQLTSKTGSGTTFKVYIPLPVVSDSKEAMNTYCLPPVIENSGTILLVDDEEELLTLGRIRLSAIGFSAITSADGIAALDIYREQADKIDLILLDILMPKMSGVETYRQLREISKTVPIVFFSGCNKDELSSSIFDDEHTGFLKKPYTPDQLKIALTEMLR